MRVNLQCVFKVSAIGTQCLCPIHPADATQLSSCVASAVCTQFANSWRQFRRDWTYLPTAKSTVVTHFTISCAVELLRLVTSDDIMTSVLKKVTNIDQNSRSQTAMFGFQIVDRIRRQSSWASCELCSYRRRWRDATRQFRRVGVGGVCWALESCSSMDIIVEHRYKHLAKLS